VLEPRGHLDPPPRRILIGAPAGAGKTTLAREIENRTGLPHTEIDALFHGPGWTVRPRFHAEVDAFTGRERWVTEWQYTTQLGLLLTSRADTLVWLDLPVHVHMVRLIRRTLHRRRHRVPLWNGNIEPPLRTILTDPEHIVRWGWKGRKKMRGRVADASSAHPHLRVVRLRSSREAMLWVQGLPKAQL
jgi:adenylate kinase family enzyme